MSEALDLARIASSLEGYGDDDTAWVAAGLVRALLAELEQARALLREAREYFGDAVTGELVVNCGCPDCALARRIDASLPAGGGES